MTATIAPVACIPPIALNGSILRVCLPARRWICLAASSPIGGDVQRRHLWRNFRREELRFLDYICSDCCPVIVSGENESKHIAERSRMRRTGASKYCSLVELATTLVRPMAKESCGAALRLKHSLLALTILAHNRSNTLGRRDSFGCLPLRSRRRSWILSRRPLIPPCSHLCIYDRCSWPNWRDPLFLKALYVR